MIRRRTDAALAALAAMAIGLAACSSGGGTTASPQPTTAASSTTTTSAGAAEDETTTTADAATAADQGRSAADAASAADLPAGAEPGLDDLDGDGTNEPTCGTADYGAGLVLRVPCEDLGLGNEPSDGVTLVERSIFSFPSGSYDLVSESSGSVIQARDAEGKQVVVLFISADTLFAVGSSEVNEPAVASIGAMASKVGAAYPGASVQVRGHTDSTGDAATNQALSEQRARNVADLLGRSGIDPATISSVGLGATQPLAVETGPDGTPNEAGRTENRRVEIVVRAP